MKYKNKRYEYQLIKNGEVHYQGFKHEIANYLKCQRIEIEEAFNYQYELQGFMVKRVISERRYAKTLEDVKKDIQSNINKESKEDRKLKYLARHLKEYGNTVYQGNRLNYYIEQLLNRGIKVKSRRVKYPQDKKEWYVLEVINDDS